MFAFIHHINSPCFFKIKKNMISTSCMGEPLLISRTYLYVFTSCVVAIFASLSLVILPPSQSSIQGRGVTKGSKHELPCEIYPTTRRPITVFACHRLEIDSYSVLSHPRYFCSSTLGTSCSPIRQVLLTLPPHRRYFTLSDHRYSVLSHHRYSVLPY